MTLVPLRRVYLTEVTREHRTGDVWSNLPTHGLLKNSHLPGVVITPACDLANEKVDTLTYLPILPISNWLATRSFYPEIRSTMLGLLDNLQLEDLGEELPTRMLPVEETVHSLKKRLLYCESKESGKRRMNATRCLQGVIHLEKMSSSQPEAADFPSLELLFGRKKFEEIMRKIVRNAYGGETHFLPSDCQDAYWSIIAVPSLVLFRYPLTAPIEVFDHAQTTDHETWEVEVGRLSRSIPFLSAFGADRPLKGLQINHEFLHDILLRYLSLFSRLGSPDFTNQAIKRIYISLGGSTE